MNRDDEKSIGNMLALWSLDFNKPERDAIAYLDRVIKFSDEHQRARIVAHIREGINKITGASGGGK
tara:strand:+ start:177 stop:374 length:198 start_codon:yes stop_codon:yes gene_type:complete